MYKKALSFLSVIWLLFSSSVSIFAQYTTTPTTVEFSELQNQTFLPASQCIDGGAQVYDNYRVYMWDNSRPYDVYTKATSTNFVDWFRFDSGKTNIELRNGQNDSFDVKWPFNIKSYGNPRGIWETVLWVRNNAGITAIGHHPTDTNIPAAQLIYRLYKEGINITTNGTVSLPSFQYYPSVSVADALTSILGNNQFANFWAVNNKKLAWSELWVECANYYVSRCGDGYIDSQSTNNHPVKLPTWSIANESCDPGANLSSYTDDVMPNGATPTATYNCTSTCTINNGPSLTIDKQQKLSSSTDYQGVGLYTPSDIEYTTPANFDFKIIITNNGGQATNVVMNDTLPPSFNSSSCAGSVTPGATAVACNPQNGSSLTSQPFTLPAGGVATFYIKGTLAAGTPTKNSVYATYTNPIDNTSGTTPIDTVDQHPKISPVIVYTKTVRNVTTNSNNGQFVEADNQTSAVVVHTGDDVQYQITVSKTGWPVTNTILSDVLPTNNGFIMSAYSINGGTQTSATSFPSTNITNLLNAGPVTVTLYGKVGSPTANAFVNTANITENGIAAGTLAPGSNVAWTVLENIPPQKPDVSIKKEVEVSPGSNTRQELSTVTAGQTVRFKITYKNISSVNALNALVKDTLPNGLTCVSATHQDGAVIPCVNNGISYTEPVMNPWVEKYIIITAKVETSLPTGVITNTATIQLPGDPVKSDPAQVQPQTITDFVITKSIVSGAVIPGTVMRYQIGFKNTGTAPISSYTITDPLQYSSYVAWSSRLNNTISVTPSYGGTTLTRWCNSTNTALNGQTVCPLQPGASWTLTFDVLVN